MFDLSLEIEPQLVQWRKYLALLQEEWHGRVIRRRKHPDKWLRYLRVLDARECGASWREIAEAVLGGQNVAASEQSAHQVHQAARDLMFNWPA